MIEDFRVVLASVPEHKELVAVISYKHVQWAQIHNANGKSVIQFFVPNDKRYWEFPLDEAIQVLEHARKRFLGIK